MADQTPAPASLVGNSSWLLFARAVSVAASVVLTVVAVRSLSTVEYGRFAFVITLVTLAVALSELGINALATRRMVEKRDEIERLLGIALAAEVATSLVAIVVLVGVAAVVRGEGSTLVLVVIASTIVVFQGALAALDAPFQSLRLLRPVAHYGLIQSLGLLVVGLPLLAAGAGPEGLVAAIGFANIVAVGAAYRGLMRLRIRPRKPRAARQVTEFVRSAAPIALTGMFATIYERIDVLLVAHFRGDRGVAFYGAALSVLAALYLVPAAISTAYFPLLSAQLRDAASDARDSFFLLVRVFLLASVPAAALLGAAAPQVVQLAFGRRYATTGELLQILSPILVLSFLNYICWQATLAAHRERGKAVIVAVGLATNVVLNLFLIPAHGVRGAAYALLATEALIAIAQGVLVHRQVFRFDFRTVLLPPLVGVVVGVAIAVLVPVEPALVLGILASCGYLAALAAQRYVALAEFEPVLAPLRRSATRSG